MIGAHIGVVVHCRKENSKTWEEVSTIIDGYREHLERLKTLVITSLKASEVNRVHEYLESYDLSKGSADEVMCLHFML